MKPDLFEPAGRHPMAAGFGGNVTGAYTKETWLTPPHVLAALGPFDLDPCAAPEPRPWATAGEHFALPDVDGLAREWHGRVWLNPPYGDQVGRWLDRLASHPGGGVALIFARTDTVDFHAHVLQRADAMLFLQGRLTFCRPDGKPAKFNGGAPSVLVSYNPRDTAVLRTCGLPGVVMARVG